MSRCLIAINQSIPGSFPSVVSEVIPMIYEPITQNDTRQADDVDKQRKSLSLKVCIAMLTSPKQVVPPIHSKSTQKSDSRLSFGNSHIWMQLCATKSREISTSRVEPKKKQQPKWNDRSTYIACLHATITHINKIIYLFTFSFAPLISTRLTKSPSSLFRLSMLTMTVHLERK